jgi:tetratricopeptide (TPR) repeat protein
MRAVIGLTLVVAFAGACAEANNETAGDRHTLRMVVLPELSRLEETVQAQLRERYATLSVKQNDPAITAADLATEYGEMGTLLLAAGLNDPAEAALLNAEMLAATQMRWPYYLGHLYRAKGDIPNSMAAFERALRSAPNDVPTMVWLAEASLDQGKPDTAEQLLTQAVSLQPRSAAVHYGLGRAALARKDFVRAAQSLEQALALDNKASIIHYSLAMAYRGLRDHQRAESHLQRRGTLQIQPDALRKGLDELLHSALTYERNADVAGNRGEWTAAAEYLKKAVAMAPTRASPRHKLGTALFYLRDRRGALEQFQEAVRLSPGFAGAHYALGVLHDEAGEHDRAIDSYSAAIKSEPAHVDARLGLANALRRSGRLDASLSEYERVLKIDPGVVKARFGYAAALIRLTRYREARDRLVEAMSLYPDEASFARTAARLFAAAPDDGVRDGRRAQEIVRTLATRQPRTIELVETMAMVSAESGEYSAAVQLQREAFAAAERAGRQEMVERLADNLKRYQAGRPCRTPWRADEPIEF